jgi:hypothetical protein
VESAPRTKNRSPDLIPLTANYEQFKKKLRTLVGTVKNYAETTEKMHASRDEVREKQPRGRVLFFLYAPRNTH